MEDETTPEERELLRRVAAGDRSALGELLTRCLPWIRDRLHARIPDVARRDGDTCDHVQEVALDVLEAGTTLSFESIAQFRTWLYTVIKNRLYSSVDYHLRQKRDAGREKPLLSGSHAFGTRHPIKDVTTPGERVARSERRAWIRAAMELLEGPEQDILLLRHEHDLSYPKIADRFEITEDAARMRFNRAATRLAAVMERLRRGGLNEILAEQAEENDR